MIQRRSEPVVLLAVEKARVMGKPEMLNSNQDSQFICHGYTDFLKINQIQVSLDGKEHRADDILIECWFRTRKNETVI